MDVHFPEGSFSVAYPEQRWLSTGEAAARLGVSREWVRLLVQRGTLRAQRTRIGFLIDPESVNQYAMHGRENPPPASVTAILDQLASIRASITGGRELTDDSTELLRQAREGRLGEW